MRLAGKKRLVQAGRWVRSRVTAGGLILGYHRISEDAADIYSICVRPDYFAEQMAVLRQQADPISLGELINGLKTGTLPPRAVAVTFDDGYADNLYEAKPLLDEHGIPATLFVATGYIGQRFWWDEIAWLLLNSRSLKPELSLQVADNVFSWHVANDSDADRRSLVEKIYGFMNGLTAEQQQQVMEQLSQLTDPINKRPDCGGRVLTPDELQIFSSSDLVTVGSHSVTHPLFANLPREAQHREIEQSKRDLETLLGKPVTAFSYPNGSSNKVTRSLLQESGYALACASYNNVTGPNTDCFNLPRFWIPDQSGNDFARWLNRWL